MSFLRQGPTTPLKHGRLSEVSAFSPVIQGRVPGERRTYEERLRFALGRLEDKLVRGTPSELQLIHTLHFGRITIIRPEQYLLFAGLDPHGRPVETAAAAGKDAVSRARASQPDFPEPVDDYHEIRDPPTGPSPDPPALPRYRTWVLTQVVFDGDVKAYFRDVAKRLGSFFDAVYENCEGYPGTANFEQFWQWVIDHQLQSDMFYSGNLHLSVTRVRELEDFKHRFDLFVTKVRSANGGRVENMDELFDQFLMQTRQRASGFPAYGGIYTGALDLPGAKK
jgi:hypothetical protein